ncbi:phytanoyl-CoA dioxygenase domain-containing protein 1 [Halyomorpha halys]|uniref:phytanoyl-CoA dioxygenase domain-containing protein 1 n=1 Tax=Halyomorpha halys TaxID=286706 RepID=UPI0006D4E460|nr:phytanoyl-CoA dioxygenase domain-containing protein 1 [Halyomorpha halys]
MREDCYDKFQKDGFLIIENFLNDEEVTRLKNAGNELSQNVPSEEQKIIFDTTQTPQNQHKYFLESGDKIRYFYEKDALNNKGELVVSSEIALNKVGHNLHWLHPVFKSISFGRKVQNLCQTLKLEDPVILQSMYIYKNPGIGSEVTPHQDATFLFTEPNSLIGLWFPLDDATLENGCLWFIPGSHENGVHRRYIRNPDQKSDELLIYDRPPVIYPSSAFIPFPTKKGSCVVIHGNVVHKSDPNKSSKSRHAYTFHIMDVSSKYSPENWLQSPNGFPLIYED